MAATAVRPEQITFDSDNTLRWYRPDDTVEYGFCATCGSSLFWRAHAQPDKLCIAAGTLDQPTGLTTLKAWWIAEAGDYHVRAPGVQEHQYED